MSHRKQNDGLKLQSYKIDTSQIQSKIYQLDQLKSDLRKSLAQQRQQQQSYVEQITKLQKQNQKLKEKIKKMQITIQSQNTLISQLEKKINKIQEQIYITQEKTQEQIQKRKEIQTQYQMRIDSLNSQIIHMKNEQQFQLRTSKVVPIQHGRDVDKAMKSNSIPSIPSDSSISSQGRKIKRLKKKEQKQEKEEKKEQHKISILEKGKQEESILPLGVRDKWTTEPIAEGQQESQLTAEDIYLEMIRQLYRQLAKIDLKAKELTHLPIIESFSNLKAPTSNDLARLLASHPFQLTISHKVPTIHQYMVKQIEKQRRQPSGNEFISEMMISLEEIDLDRELSLMSSSLDSELKGSQLSSSGFKKVTRPVTSGVQEEFMMGSQETIQELSQPSEYQ